MDAQTPAALLHLESDHDPRFDADFARWCAVHHAELLRVDGFRRARRFVRAGDVQEPGRRLLTVYELANADVLEGEGYRRHSETYTPMPDEIAESVVFRRSIGVERTWYGSEGGLDTEPGTACEAFPESLGLVHLWLGSGDAPRDELAAWCDELLLPGLQTRPGVVGYRQYELLHDGPDVQFAALVTVDRSAFEGPALPASPPGGAQPAVRTYRPVFVMTAA